MLENIFLGSKYYDWIESLKGNRAIDKHEKKCLQCGFCCAVRPCVPTPDELKTISEYLKLDVNEAVKKYFVGDRIGGTSINIIFPAKKTQLDITGTFISAERTYDKGYCVFFDEVKKECIINPVKPKHAKLSYCWKDDEISTEPVEAWKNIDIESFGVLMNEDYITKSFSLNRFKKRNAYPPLLSISKNFSPKIGKNKLTV